MLIKLDKKCRKCGRDISNQEYEEHNGYCVMCEERLISKKEKINKKKKENKKQISPQEEIIYKRYEEDLKMTFGTKVNINRKSRDKGRIEIEYYSQSEFERILELINGIKNESEVN